VVDAGTLPSAGLGMGAALTLKLDVIRFALGAQWLPGRTTEIAAITGASAQLSSAMAVARGCVAFRASAFDFGPCALLELGSIWGDARGISDPSAGHALWLAFGAGVEARWRFAAPWAVWLGGALMVPHLRRNFYVRSDDAQISAYQVPAATPRAMLGIAYEVR
jgi:hypothetical protein